ncbi:type II toxin-antitoxin system HigB family toxin [Rufibacter sp. XAAS-G3-1]|uniref:type II toxin-antitoxin system HigB family toxin n=1 Tax=Rufibacter sp. XAAS-G3-1 TaxID=2729134 RepID=UPI0015E72079|nr:type II toxin-antitoxin system HigB family toxin [Rufibacter sp. XAAS-G3-1]
MRIISNARLIEFYTKHADSKLPLEVWVSIIKGLEIKNLNELKKVFNSVDILGNNRAIFDIKGNRYRIITVVLVKNQTVYIRWIGTHAEYDRIDAHSV